MTICKDCTSCKLGFFSSKPDSYVCIGAKTPFVIKDVNTECEVSSYRNIEKGFKVNRHVENTQPITEAIKFFNDWIMRDLYELAGDTTSDYAKFRLNEHKHINLAIEELTNIVNPTRGYAE